MAAHKQSINLPEDLYRWVRAKADRHHISVSAEINVILSELMEREGHLTDADDSCKPLPDSAGA